MIILRITLSNKHTRDRYKNDITRLNYHDLKYIEF